MRIADVIATYPYCDFCGRGVHEDLAYRPDVGGVYHSKECFEFSRRYPALVERLARLSAPVSDDAHELDEEADDETT